MSDNLYTLTHNGKFHLDEIAALVMLSIEEITTDNRLIFKNIFVGRVAHADNIDELKESYRKLGHMVGLMHDDSKYCTTLCVPFGEIGYVLDTGRNFDNKKFFDHHQWKYGKSTAGLIYDTCKTTIGSVAMDRLCISIDDNDTGIKPMAINSLAGVVNSFNHDVKSYDDVTRYDAFRDAFYVVRKYFKYIIETALEEDKIRITVLAGKRVTETVIDIGPRNNLGKWGDCIDGVKENLEAVIWENEDGTYAGKVMNEPGSYERIGRGFEKDKSMKFVHESGFYCVAPDKETMLKYIVVGFESGY